MCWFWRGFYMPAVYISVGPFTASFCLPTQYHIQLKFILCQCTVVAVGLAELYEYVTN